MKRFVFKMCTLKEAFYNLLHRLRNMKEIKVAIELQIFRAFTEEISS